MDLPDGPLQQAEMIASRLEAFNKRSRRVTMTCLLVALACFLSGYWCVHDAVPTRNVSEAELGASLVLAALAVLALGLIAWFVMAMTLGKRFANRQAK